MTEYEVIELPLYQDPAYNYDVVLERVSYNFSFYYNTVMKAWIYSVSYSDGTPLLSGMRLVPNYRMLERYPTQLTGFLALMPIGKNRLETISNPYEIYKYYKLYYYTPIVEEEDGRDISD